MGFDLFRTKHIVKKIKRKTFSWKMNVLSIFTDLEENVKIEPTIGIDCISVYDEKDIKKYNFLTEYFPILIRN